MKNTNSSGLASKKWKVKTSGERAGRLWLRFAVSIGLGLILPGAAVYGGYSPFGIGLVAAVNGPYGVPVFFSTAVGYALWGGANGLRYMASLIAVIGMRWSVAGFPQVLRSPWFAPSLSFLCTLLTGSALLLNETRTVYDVLLIVSEALLAAGFSYFTSSAWNGIMEEEKTNHTLSKQAGLVALLAVTVMALFSLEWEGISLGRIVAVFCILLSSQYFGLLGGCISGSVFGLISFLSKPSLYFLIPVFAFGGLLAGLFARRGKIVAALAYACVNVIVFTVFRSQVSGLMLVALYEVLAACVLSYGVPVSAQQRITQWFFQPTMPGQDAAAHSAAASMTVAADAMDRIAGTVDTVSKQMATLSAPELGSFYRDSTAQVCDTCKKRWDCWESHFSQAMESFHGITTLLEQGEGVVSEQFTGYLKDNCHRLSDLCVNLNSGYKEYLVRQSAFRRLHELRGVITDQFANTAQILREFSCRFSDSAWCDENTAQLIKKELKKQEVCVMSLACYRYHNNRMEMDLEVKGILTPDEAQWLCNDIGRWCNCTLSVVTVEGVGDITSMHFAEGIAFCVSLGVSQLKCKGEQLCGDAFELFQDISGNFFVILSDGMGCGGRAAVDGAMTAGLSAQLLQAGFGFESVLRLANTALMAKSGEETLATLDIAAINLYTGETEFLKAGAGLSLLLSRGCISRIEDSSLPLGILREITFARTKDRLVAGDILIVMSDGITNSGVRWVEELLRNFDAENGDIQKLADNITQTAQRMCKDEKGDDMTVITVKLESVV